MSELPGVSVPEGECDHARALEADPCCGDCGITGPNTTFRCADCGITLDREEWEYKHEKDWNEDDIQKAIKAYGP